MRLRSFLIAAGFISASLTASLVVVLAAQQAPAGPGRQAQQPTGQPARDAAGQQPRAVAEPATGRISGRVSAADTGRPLKGARVTLTAGQGQGGGGGTFTTDESGAFDFPQLPEGRYTLNVSKAGFVTLAYGQRRPLQPGTPLQLTNGQALKDLDMRLPRGSAIGGHVADEFGEPMPGITVRVMRQQFVQGEQQLTQAGSGQTDDRGQYRVWGLNPGDYYISAVAPTVAIAGLVEVLGGGGRGRIAEVLGAMQRPEDVTRIADEILGRLVVSGTVEREQPIAYAPTYYPGVASAREAQPITVGLSAEALNMDFSLQLVRMARISGRVTSQDGGSIAGGTVNLSADGQGGGAGGGRGGFLGGNYGARIQNDGAFVIANVPPGQYVLRARADTGGRGGDRGGRAGAGNGAAGRGGRGGAAAIPAGDRTARFASQPLSVAGDMSDINVALVPGGTLSGTIVLHLSGATRAPDMNQVRVLARPADPSIGQETNARVEASGQFTMEGVPAGPHWFRVQAPRGMSLKSVMLGGRNVTDAVEDIQPGEKISGVTLVLTDRLSEINGTMTDDRGTPISDYTVLAFPDDAALWGPQSRHILTARPDQNGKFQIRGLPASRYFLVAIDPTNQGEWLDPAFLEQHKDGAARVSLGEGDVKTQDFRVATK